MPTLFIKNMVCNRCILVVQNELDKIGVQPNSIQLGEVKLDSPLDDAQMATFNQAMLQLGFEIMDDKKSQLIEQIKKTIIQEVHYQKEATKVNLSHILSAQLGYDYNYLSNLFSEVEGITIEKYWIAQKIERVKELLVYDELTLTQIAAQLHYSSVAHLSNQFKKVTGLSPTFFKNAQASKRKPLDKV